MIAASTEVLEATEEIKLVPKRLHSVVRQRIIALLASELGLDVALPELAVAVLDSEGRQIVPDVVVVSPRSEYANGALTSGGDLAVEIMSPKQSFSEMLEKCERILAADIVPVCWLLWPENGAAYTFDTTLRQEHEQLAFRWQLSRLVTVSVNDLLGSLPPGAE